MADKRIYELTDEQASYVNSLLVAVEDGGGAFTSTKKMRLDAIYKKIFELSEATGVNIDQFLLRLDNATGAESKIKLSDFINLFTDNDEVVDVPLYDANGFYSALLTCRRIGKMVTGILKKVSSLGTSPEGDIMTTDGTGSIAYTLPSNMRPKHQVSVYVASGVDQSSDSTIVKTDGSIQCVFWERYDGLGLNFSLAWVTE
jgi:hypothetical protein